MTVKNELSIWPRSWIEMSLIKKTIFDLINRVLDMTKEKSRDFVRGQSAPEASI